MKRVIVNYSKLTNEILNLLVERFPDGYDDSNIIRFKNHKNETIEAVEVRTKDTVYLVKISTQLSDRLINFDFEDDIAVPIDVIKQLEIDEAEVDEDENEIDLTKDSEDSRVDEDDDDNDDVEDESDEDESDEDE